MKHEAPFKPSNPPKKGHKGFLAPFPEYKGDPIKPTTRKDVSKGKDPFKFLSLTLFLDLTTEAT
jgi:hypothetical protein